MPSSSTEGRPGPYVIPLCSVRPGDAARAGAKAERLGRALQGGFAVPDGFVVTTAAFAAHLAPLEPGVTERMHALAAGDLGAIAAAGGELRRLVEQAALPPAVERAIRDAHRALGATAVAVRSSAPAEDGQSRSLAGHFDSFLDVRGEDEVAARVKQCFGSWFSERALAATLRERPGAAPPDPAMAVIVQRMAPCEHAGILFTRDPRGGDGRRMLVELARGGGAKVAAGEVTPARYALDRESGLAERVGGEPAEGVEPRAELFAALAEVGRRVEALFGAAQDIEWAAEGERVFLLQARPITGIAASPGAGAVADEEWTPANSQEALDGPVTPLTYSFLRPMIERGRRAVFAWLEVPEIGGEYMRLIDGRVYFNARYFRTFLERVPGIPNEIFDHLIFGERIGPDAQIRFPRPPIALRTARVLSVVLRSWWEAKDRLDRFVEAFDARIRTLARGNLGDLADEALRAHLAAVAGELEAAFNMHVLGTALAGGHYLLLSKFLKAHGLGAGLNAADELIAAAPGMETARSGTAIFALADLAAALPEARRVLLEREPRAALAAMAAPDFPGGAAFRAALDRFLDEFGHRAEEEAELAAPRWREDPSFILRLVRRVLAEEDGPFRDQTRADAEPALGAPPRDPRRPRAGDPASRLHALRARKREIELRLEREIDERFSPLTRGARKAALRALIRRAERYAPYRENLRFHALRAYELVRLVFLEVGRRLAARGALRDAEDVFFLEADEALAALEDRAPAEPAALAREAAERRARYRALALERPADPSRPSPAPAGAGGGRRWLEGVPVSGGVVTGRIRRADTLEQALQARPDEILCARAATPAWTPVFFLVRGVVLDIGGMLSHCAVIAREYGIPCVVGAKNATALLADGALVTLDANAGRVYFDA